MIGSSALLFALLLAAPEPEAPDAQAPTPPADELVPVAPDSEGATPDGPATDAAASEIVATEPGTSPEGTEEPAAGEIGEDEGPATPADGSTVEDTETENEPAEEAEAPEPEPEPEPIPEPEPEPAYVGPPPVTPLQSSAEPIIRVRRPIPRALSTINGNPPSEVAAIERGRLRFEPGVQLRNQVGWVSPFPLDRVGESYEEGALSTGRLRWSPRLSWGRIITLTGMLDLINGRWAPDGSTDPVIDQIIEEGQPPGRTELRLVDPRELYVDLTTPLGLLRVGQQSFTWGQGILANNGNVLDRFGDMRFGDDGPGDIYERILFLTKPFKYRAGRIKDLAFGVGGDLVFRDERVQLTRGDRAWQGLVVVRYDSSSNPGNSIGGYAVYRTQRNIDDGDVYPDDEDLEVGAFDLTGQGTLWIRDDFQLMGAFEGALIAGRAEFARDERGDHRVVQGGAAVRGYLGDHDRWLVGFDGGYASGDADPNDRAINNFTFDQGHTVGLLMFNQVLGWRTARSQMLAEDPMLTGVPSNGTQFIPTRGGVSNAIYLHPKARWSLRERFEVWGGPLLAAAPVPIVDPYAAQLGGGQPTSSLGGDGHRRFYGTELDLGIRGRFSLGGLWLQAGLQGALLLPGPAMADAAGDTGGPVGAVWFRTEVRY